MTPCNYTTLLFKPNLRSGFFWFISGKFKPWVRGNSPSCRGTFLILIYTEINIYLKSWTKFLLNNCQPSKLEQKKIIVNRQSYNPPPAPLSRPPLRERKKLKDETIEDGGIVRYLAWDHALSLLSLYVSLTGDKEANKKKSRLISCYSLSDLAWISSDYFESLLLPQ